MKEKSLYIFGDSFSVSNKDSWAEMLENEYKIYNFSSNGSSEYRIWKNYQNIKDKIKNDKVLFCHTSPSRIFLKNQENFSSRMLPSHPFCDLIFSDIYAKKEKKFQKILQQIWDEDFFSDTYQLMLTDSLKIKNSTHISFFDIDHCVSFRDIWKNYPGNINHLSVQGNIEIYQNLKTLL
jgi:hypothetical protein